MSTKPTNSMAGALALQHNLPLSLVERALGVEPSAASLQDASARYKNERHENDKKKASLLLELERWVLAELESADSGQKYRLIQQEVPETSPIMLRVNRAWDYFTREQLVRCDETTQASEVHDVLRGARETSQEWYSADKMFDQTFARDLRKASRNKAVNKLFKLLAIAKPEKRMTVEVALMRCCRSEKAWSKLAHAVRDPEHQAEAIRRLGNLSHR